MTKGSKGGARASRPQCLASRRTHLRPTPIAQGGARRAAQRPGRSRSPIVPLPPPVKAGQTKSNRSGWHLTCQIVCNYLIMNGLRNNRFSVRSDPVKLGQTTLKAGEHRPLVASSQCPGVFALIFPAPEETHSRRGAKGIEILEFGLELTGKSRNPESFQGLRILCILAAILPDVLGRTPVNPMSGFDGVSPRRKSICKYFTINDLQLKSSQTQSRSVKPGQTDSMVKWVPAGHVKNCQTRPDGF